ncbi:MAG: hypothetical protein JWP97_5569, partial [Labilithrix sp.]|nr:hypothetical protein [Labilithrix sp.]
GAVAASGAGLRAGDVVEAQGARAVLDRPRKVAWLLEANGTPAQVARAHVKAAGDSLVVGLDDGAIEAQVVPVAQGEAFAVDVASGSSLVRVAVHGTHLRVARDGSRVTVDLTEGVVAIGNPPAAGTTVGTTITAPSHVEFDAADLRTLKVDHAPSAVRAAIALVPAEAPAAADPAAVQAAAPSLPPGRSHGREAPRPSAAPPAGTHAAARSPAAAREAIAQAVRSCAASHGSSGSVRVTVKSSLELKVGASGKVEAARFDPPLAPEIQACAAAAIYALEVDDAANGGLHVPIEFSY